MSTTSSSSFGRRSESSDPASGVDGTWRHEPTLTVLRLPRAESRGSSSANHIVRPAVRMQGLRRNGHERVCGVLPTSSYVYGRRPIARIVSWEA